MKIKYRIVKMIFNDLNESDEEIQNDIDNTQLYNDMTIEAERLRKLYLEKRIKDLKNNVQPEPVKTSIQEKNHENYIKNKDKIKAYNQKEERQTKLKEYSKNYYQNNKDKLKKYYEDNKEGISLARKERYPNLKEKANAYNKTWRDNNPEKVKLQTQRKKVRYQEKKMKEETEYWKQQKRFLQGIKN